MTGQDFTTWFLSPLEASDVLVTLQSEVRLDQSFFSRGAKVKHSDDTISAACNNIVLLATDSHALDFCLRFDLDRNDLLNRSGSCVEQSQVSFGITHCCDVSILEDNQLFETTILLWW